METIAENLLGTSVYGFTTTAILILRASIFYIFPLVSHLLISIFSICLATAIPMRIGTYSNLGEKNQYIKIFQKRYTCIENYSNSLSIYKKLRFHSIMAFYVGVIGAIAIVAGLLNASQSLIQYGGMDADTCAFFDKYTGMSIDNMTFENILTSINTVFIILIIVISWASSRIRVDKKKELSYPPLTEKGVFKDPVKRSYMFYWLFGGILFGMIFLLYFIDFGLLREYAKIDDIYLLNWTSFTNIYMNIKIIEKHVSPQICEFVFVILIISTLMCIMTLKHLVSQIRSSSKKLNEGIINYYKSDFPYITIGTESGKIEGQLTDIQNKSLISLHGDNILNIVPWKKIVLMEVKHEKMEVKHEKMEVKHENKNEHNNLDDSSKQ